MEKCNDKKCYKHGSVRVRGFRMKGTVISDKGKHTVIVEREMWRWMPKYHRIAKKKVRIAAHNPPCINASVGDTVLIGETRKISKTKAWTVIEVLERKVVE